MPAGNSIMTKCSRSRPICSAIRSAGAWSSADRRTTSSEASWSAAWMIPLVLEAELLALAGFAVGLLVGYVIELRRRANRWKKRI